MFKKYEKVAVVMGFIIYGLFLHYGIAYVDNKTVKREVSK